MSHLDSYRRCKVSHFLHLPGKAVKEHVFVYVRTLRSFETSVNVYESSHLISYKPFVFSALGDGTDRLYRNVGKELPLLAPQ